MEIILAHSSIECWKCSKRSLEQSSIHSKTQCRFPLPTLVPRRCRNAQRHCCSNNARLWKITKTPMLPDQPPDLMTPQPSTLQPPPVHPVPTPPLLPLAEIRVRGGKLFVGAPSIRPRRAKVCCPSSAGEPPQRGGKMMKTARAGRRQSSMGCAQAICGVHETHEVCKPPVVCTSHMLCALVYRTDQQGVQETSMQGA